MKTRQNGVNRKLYLACMKCNLTCAYNHDLGLVLDRKVDFAADSFGITELRSRVISYLPLFAGGKSRIYIKNPRETFDWEIYTKPFRKVTWVGVMSFSVILPVLMVITMVNCKPISKCVIVIWCIVIIFKD